MSAWAYRECPGCGERIPINCYCSKCGGDPWNIEGNLQMHFNGYEKQILQLVEELDSRRKVIKQFRKWMIVNVDERKRITELQQSFIKSAEDSDASEKP